MDFLRTEMIRLYSLMIPTRRESYHFHIPFIITSSEVDTIFWSSGFGLSVDRVDDVIIW